MIKLTYEPQTNSPLGLYQQYPAWSQAAVNLFRRYHENEYFIQPLEVIQYKNGNVLLKGAFKGDDGYEIYPFSVRLYWMKTVSNDYRLVYQNSDSLRLTTKSPIYWMIEMQQQAEIIKNWLGITDKVYSSRYFSRFYEGPAQRLLK